MLKKLIIIIFGLTLSLGVKADQLTIKADAPTVYVVEKGDTLWDISGIFLDQPWLWPKLWRLNPDIDNPHLIYPGDELRLVFDEFGEPMLIKGKPSLKWSPKVRAKLKDQEPINSISLNDISPYLKYDQVLTEAEMDELPYVIGSDEGYKSSVDGFKVYVRGDLPEGKGYAIYHRGEEVFDPETGESLGFYAKLVGTAKGIVKGDVIFKKPSTLYVDGPKREIRSGDLVMPINQGQLLPAFFNLQAPAADIDATIVKSSSGVREFSKFEVVMLNKGQQDNVELGDVLVVNRLSPLVVETAQGPKYNTDASRWDRLTERDAKPYNMPQESVGSLMVFKVYQQVSMALILKATKPLRISDNVQSPEDDY